MAKINCLLITTNDNRRLFTYKKNLKQLGEFSKVLKTEILVVRAENPDILTLEELAPAICDSNCRSKAKFEILGKTTKRKKSQNK